MKTLVVCGDSYAYGIGCTNLYTQPFGVCVAKEFGWDLIRLARGSASNYTIYLQGMYAANMENPPHLIILSMTSHDRVEWVKEGALGDVEHKLHDLRNLNYHQYPPHHHPQPHHEEPMPFHFKGDDLYDPYILSEQIIGLEHCLGLRKNKEKFEYYERLDTEPIEKLQLILDHHIRVGNYVIKQNYDVGMLLQAYTYIKKKNINCILLANQNIGYVKYDDFFDKEDIFQLDWGKLSLNFPDKIGSMHTSEEGHEITAKRLIRRIKELKLA